VLPKKILKKLTPKGEIFMMKRIFLSILLLMYTIACPKTDISYTQVDETTKKIDLSIKLSEGDFIYKDYIDISVDSPNVQLSSWQTDQETIKHFSKEFRETKNIFKKNLIISFNAKKKNDFDVQDAHIHVTYYLNSKKGVVEEIFPFNCPQPCSCCSCCLNTNINTVEKQNIEKQSKNNISKAKKESWTDYLSGLVKTTQSTWVRILLAFLLGVLLSLTPCIYPMVPITVGILQAQGSKSIFYNFLLSFTYTAGIAVTFAVLGLIAAFTGQIFGSILVNPIFVIILVLILVYLALSLFGFYEIYIPRFMQKTGGGIQKTSLLSIFLFGVASGSVASPCVSPGLILLLSIVTAIGSKLLGFILLFSFGIGLGLPLIIIGTFSGSMNMLPKAGAWMIEIKKIFGLMMFGVCFYFLNNILPLHITLWLISIFMLIVGAYYLANVKSYDSKFWKIFKNLVGVGCCVFSIFIGFKAYKATYLEKEVKPVETFWQKDYTKAIEQAKKEGKKVFLDFFADWCTLCKIIDKRLFKNSKVQAAMNQVFVNVKLDGTSPANEPFATLQKKYKVIGFPTFLLIDPNTQNVIKKWSSELNDVTNEEFIKEIKSYESE